MKHDWEQIPRGIASRTETSGSKMGKDHRMVHIIHRPSPESREDRTMNPKYRPLGAGLREY